MIASFKAEWLKLNRRPLVWLLGAMLVGLVVLLGYVFSYATMRNLEGDPANAGDIAMIRIVLSGENAAIVVLDVLARFGGWIAVVLGAMLVGSEFSWNTVKTVLTQRGGRRSILAGTLFAYGAALAVAVAISVAAAIASSLVIATMTDIAPQFPDLSTLAPAMGAAWLSLVTWTLLGAVLASVFRSAALAVSVGLVYALAIENAVALLAERVTILGQVAKFTIGRNAQALAQALMPEGVDVPTAVAGSLQATLMLLLVAGVAAAVMLVLQRRDYA